MEDNNTNNTKKEFKNTLEITTWCDTSEWVIIPTIRVFHREFVIEWLCFSIDFFLARHER